MHYFPDHNHIEQLQYARIASDISVSQRTVEGCIEKTMRLFSLCIENGKNVAFVLNDVGMLVIQGKDVKIRFYKDFLKRLNGTEKMLEALLGVRFPFF